MTPFLISFCVLLTEASALLPKSIFDKRTECDLIRLKSCYKTFILHSVDVSKNGVDQEPHSLESQCEWQRELDACLGPDEMRLCLKAENLRKVFPDQDAADNISEYGMLKFKCGEGHDLWNRHSECLNFRNSTAKFMEQIAKCASGKNFLIFFQSFLKRESRVQMSLPCRFLKSIISCVEEAAVAQCGPEAKPMFCKFFQLAPFQQFLVGDRQGIASELKNCPVEVSHCSQE